MAAARKMVEDWAVQMKDRNLLTYKDAAGGDPKGIVHTLVGEVTKPSSDACRSWLKYGRCKPNELGKCSWKHDVKKKGINAPSPSVAGGTTKATAPSASTGKTLRDYSTLTCKECKVVGHSAYWSGCPSKLAKAKSINNKHCILNQHHQLIPLLLLLLQHHLLKLHQSCLSMIP